MANLTPDTIAAAAAVVLSLLATYLPGFNTWHAKLSGEAKQLLWAGILLAVTVGAVTWGCNAEAGCIIRDWRDYLAAFVGALLLAVGANQGAYLLSPQPKAVQAARLEGKLRRGQG